jgi:thymidylate synthase ThyX
MIIAPSSTEHLVARLVWDGGENLSLPPEMGLPADGQLSGSVGERLCELAGRVCYDSLGKGRSSADYHKHIHEVKHYSVYEHAVMTALLKPVFAENGGVRHWVDPSVFLNRPGVWVDEAQQGFRITFNPRVILDWNNFGRESAPERMALARLAAMAWPQICPLAKEPTGDVLDHLRRGTEIVPPAYDEECWITMFMGGSRGFSHELVRHGDFTAISQRSTRYVDEGESPWVDHPLVQEFLASKDPLPDDPDNRIRGALASIIGDLKHGAREVYSKTAEQLQKWLSARGVDKLTARKQARGAARGYLGNALYTELVFSASVAQWKRMLRMRACAAADAEIREVFVQALYELKRSRYAPSFNGFKVQPAPDGIGQVVVEESA